MALATVANLDEALASRLAADLLYRALLEVGEPAKASEVARLVGRENVDLRLARVILVMHPDRFTLIERKWTLWSRFASKARPVDRNLRETIGAFGLPVCAEHIACEMAHIYDRPIEVYQTVVDKLLATGDKYFRAGDNWGLKAWLLSLNPEVVEPEDDVLLDNYLEPEDVEPFAQAAASLQPTDLDSVVAFLDAAGEPVPNRVLQFLVWRVAQGDFKPEAFFNKLMADGRATFLSDTTWVGPAVAARAMGLFPAMAEREVVESAEAQAPEAAEPLTITDEERDQLVEYVVESEHTARASNILEEMFEVTQGDATYDADLETVMSTLQSDERVRWVGADRFVPEGTIPPYVFAVPDILRFPETHYTDAEGNEVDLLLEDDGFDGGLDRDIRAVMAQDVLDEEPATEPDAVPPATARCVLKYHHKEIGTFPLAQLPPGFFPTQASITQADLILPNGHTCEIWVNNETRLVYGLLDWYPTLPVDSGAVFYLERQSDDRYVLTYGEETEPAVFISRNRLNELLELGQRADAEEAATFEIVREILEHYRKGIEFITVLTETNIARRTTRRMIASILSEYHCFFQRGGAWVYDARKLSQGFDKSKRKYLHK